MTKRKIFVIMFILLAVANAAYASDIDTWQDPSVNVQGLKKIFIMPVNANLNAGKLLMPAGQLNKSLTEWEIAGINSAFKRKGMITIKTLEAVLDDMKFIHGDDITSNDATFFKRAAEMGYKAFVRTDIRQEFKTEHVPESTRTWTEYKEIEKRDAKGKVIETLRIPEEKTEVTPAHDVTYLETVCEPKLYMTEDYNGEYKAIVNYRIYREYMNGPVIQVVENIIKASLKNLFTPKK